jgi:deoxyhypusine synthase
MGNSGNSTQAAAKLVSDMPTKKELLTQPIQHIDIKQHDVVALVDAMQHMAYSSRDLARASSIYERMLRDQECGVILCLAGSLISAGLKNVFVDLIRNNMVDAIVSTGANIVDQDFFEALGFKHWIADELYKQGTEDATLRELMIDRIYDTLIDEEELRHCDRPARTARVSSSARWARTWSARARPLPEAARTRSFSRRMRRTCRSSAPHSPTARPASAWWPTSMRGRASRWSPSTPQRTFTN